MKLMGFPAPVGHGHLPLLFMAAGFIETIGAALIALGLFTRPAAFIASGEMAVAYFKVHILISFWPALNHGEPVIFFCFVFLYLILAGTGPWSLDAKLFVSRAARQNHPAKSRRRCPDRGQSRGGTSMHCLPQKLRSRATPASLPLPESNYPGLCHRNGQS